MSSKRDCVPLRCWPAAFLAILLLIVATAPLTAHAQSDQQIQDPQPLRPANTASPRDTLRSFLDSANKALKAWRANAEDAASFRAYRRAVATLDLRTTPNGRTWKVRTERLLYLKEILDRIPLPPEDQIPGVDEVADNAVTEWTIPDTEIQIARVESGPRAGEFLFTAGTVAQLDRFYRQSKHLPYKPGVTAGYLEEVAGSERTAAAVGSSPRERLKPVDTSSPLSTLEGFLDSVNRAYVLVMEADAALAADPPTLTLEEARAIESRANSLLARAAATLDLSEVPEALRADVGIESALQLKEILDRMLLPPIDAVLDTQLVAAARRGEVKIIPRADGPLYWRYPNTEIDIVEIITGPRAGQFLFSSDTVNKIADFYESIKDLEYRDPKYLNIDIDYLSAEISPAFYDYYISTPGYLIPQAYYLAGLVQELPKQLNALYLGQTWWQWIGLFVCVLAVLLLGLLVFHVTTVLAGRLEAPWRQWIHLPAPALAALILAVAADFANAGLNITGDVLSLSLAVKEVAIVLLVAWTVWRLFRAIAESIITSPRISQQGIDASLIRIVLGLLSVIVAIGVLVAGLQRVGVDAVPLLAGLGVGGLAVALAIRPTLENLIGGMILFTDKPVRIGDFCSFAGMMGTIENIGVRSTQIRGLDRTLISIPNAKFADMELVNYAHCDRMLIQSTIGLRYETEPDVLRYVLVKMREMFHAHPKIDRDTVRVRFAGYGASSLDISVRVYALTHDWNEFHAIKEDVFLRIGDIVTASGTGFAFPSQTLYMQRDDGVDEERMTSAAQEVDTWRRGGELPFPRLRDSRMDQLQGTLDYPPRGSTEVPELLSAEPPPDVADEDEAKKAAEDLPKR